MKSSMRLPKQVKPLCILRLRCVFQKFLMSLSVRSGRYDAIAAHLHKTNTQVLDPISHRHAHTSRLSKTHDLIRTVREQTSQ
jgi:hypothetical protein